MQKINNFVENNSQLLAAVRSILIDRLLGNPTQSGKEYGCVDDFLKSALNDIIDSRIKKVLATVLVAADESGVQPLPEDMQNAEDVAVISDETATRIKTAYQVDEDMINPLEAQEAIYDRPVVRTASFVDKIVNKATRLVDWAANKTKSISDLLVAKGLPKIGNWVGKAVSKVFPPAAVVAPYIGKFCSVAAPKVQRVVRKGIGLVASGAKKVVKTVAKVGSSLVSAGKKTWNFVKSLI